MNKQKQCNLAAVFTFMGTLSVAFTQPHITTQPVDRSVSLGPNVTNLVFATGVAPLAYQWRFNDEEIVGATTRTLILTNVQMANAGGYSIVVTNLSGSVTSRVATLNVDPAFTMITTGPISTDIGLSGSASWGDYDNDGFPDLLIGNVVGPVSFLYHNRGDGTFERVLTNAIGGLSFGGGLWADYDNDGFLDLYMNTARDLGVHLYHNQGNGTLLLFTNADPITTNHTFSGGGSWGDYDNDGFLDMYLANGTFDGDHKNFLFHSQRNGTFSRVPTGSMVNDLGDSWAGSLVDYDDDGRLDIFVANNGTFTSTGKGEDNQLYHNEGAGVFTRLAAAQDGLPAGDGGYSRFCTWGDYDNDGYIDLFVSGQTNLLYHNNGNGTFKKIILGEVVTDSTVFESIGCSWVDYDNDGYLDLFVINVVDNNFLYHNNGNGTFTRILTGSLVNDGTNINSVASAWADYDNDGFMDVVIVSTGNGNNALFHNNGNSNHWINLKLVGTASNRSGVGAKVRLLATIGGKTFWQRRDISASLSEGGQSDLRASFGLGDATNIDTVRIEWPSGTIQELHNVTSKQFLTVTEPAQLKGSLVAGQYQLVLNGGIGFTYALQTSSDLVNWFSLANILTTNMTMPMITLDPAKTQQQYFRAQRQ